jgi:putative CocE/NonD family hydrolase
MVVAVLAGLGLASALATSQARADESARPRTSSRPAEHDVVVESDVQVPMHDGVRLAVDLYRPARGGQPIDGRFPALLTRTPYDKKSAAAEGRYYAARGYVVVANDVRGRYASEGTWRMMADDPQDGHDVVEWIASQPWSDGKVGTFGTSYPGGTQHALAETRPSHLTTMVPIDALSNCGISGMRHGGAFELRFMNWIFQTGAPNSHAALQNPALRQALIESGQRIREHVDNLPVRPGLSSLRLVPEYEAWLVEAMSRGGRDPFWHIKGMSVVDHVADYADVPVLHVTGWYDSWTRQVSLNYLALAQAKTAPQRLVIGPWTHGSQGSNVSGEVEFSEDAAIDLLAFRLRWYDHWLKGEANGLKEDPAVLLYVMGTGDDRRSKAGRLQHGGFWRAEREWPPARTQLTRLYLRPSGTLSSRPPREPDSHTTFTYDPQHPVPTIGGNISSNQGLIAAGGYDQRPRDDTHAADNRLPLSERRDVVVFRTAPLKADLEVTGTVDVALWVRSSAPSTDFTAKLIEEIPPNPDYPLGFDLNLGDSIIRINDALGIEPDPSGSQADQSDDRDVDDDDDDDRDEKAQAHGHRQNENGARADSGGGGGRTAANDLVAREVEGTAWSPPSPEGSEEEIDVPLYSPGTIIPIRIRLYPTSNVFKKGHRLRIDVSSSNYPRFDRNPNTGEPAGRFRRMVPADNTIYHDATHPSHVVLPVIP